MKLFFLTVPYQFSKRKSYQKFSRTFIYTKKRSLEAPIGCLYTTEVPDRQDQDGQDPKYIFSNSNPEEVLKIVDQINNSYTKWKGRSYKSKGVVTNLEQIYRIIKL